MWSLPILQSTGWVSLRMSTPKISTPKMPTPKISTPKMPTPKMSTSQNLKSHHFSDSQLSLKDTFQLLDIWVRLLYYSVCCAGLLSDYCCASHHKFKVVAWWLLSSHLWVKVGLEIIKIFHFCITPFHVPHKLKRAWYWLKLLVCGAVW